MRDRVGIAEVVGRVVKLRGGGKPRGQCPFHGSKSDSFSLDPGRGRARCWGCGWTGDAIAFVKDYHGLSFIAALEQLEGGASFDRLAPAPVHREKRAPAQPSANVVDSIVMGRHLWKSARWQPDAVRTYYRARGVPLSMLGDRRLADIRFVGLAPIVPWPIDGKPDNVPQAPAIVALVRRLPTDGPRAGMPPGPDADLDDWPPIGVHVTWLRPDLAGKMVRKKKNGDAYPARKMLGPVGGGGVWLPGDGFGLPPRAPLFGGEGIETVLSGMAIAAADDAAWGLAMLSLDNLQGAVPRVRGAIPIYDPRPSEERPPLCFAHGGPVTGLIDADMAPLRGPVDRKTGIHRGEALIEVRRAPIVHRTLTTAERAALCGTLFVRAWRDAGCPDVRAIRPPMGQDFNDAVGGYLP